jgi:hypothetical protein
MGGGSSIVGGDSSLVGSTVVGGVESFVTTEGTVGGGVFFRASTMKAAVTATAVTRSPIRKKGERFDEGGAGDEGGDGCSGRCSTGE